MRYFHWIAVALVCLVPAASFAQERTQAPKSGPAGPVALQKDTAPKGPTPKMPDGKPDLSGVWNPTNFVAMGLPSLQPSGRCALQGTPREPDVRAGDDPGEDIASPRACPESLPFPMKMVQTPSLVVMLEEGNVHSYRQFFLDGRGHAKDLDPLWMGDSVAKWDGGTLVVDTIGFNDKTWLNGQGDASRSDQLHVTEIASQRRWTWGT